MNIVILHDAISDDSRPDEVDALRQAELVRRALRESGHEVATKHVGLDLQALSVELWRSRPDLVFNLVESLAGYGRLVPVVPAMLEALAIPFTGSGSNACFLTTDKPLAKAWMHRNHVPTPAWRCGDGPAMADLAPPCDCIVKPAAEDASVGIDDAAVMHIAGQEALDAAIDRAAARYGRVFAEAFVEGREFNISLLADGDQVDVLPVAEIVFVDYPADKPHIVGYAAKWDEGSFEYTATDRRFDFSASDDLLLERLRVLAVQCWQLFELRGYARVDFRVDGAGQPWVIEVNANPCLADDAGFMAATRQHGLIAREVIARIVDASVATPSRRAEVLRA